MIQVEDVALEDLAPDEGNPRKISAQDAKALRRSLTEYGAVEPAVVNADGTIIGGHQRVAAARDLGWKTFPIVRVDLDEAKARALNLALNRISGDWDEAKLGTMLSEIEHADRDLLPLTGFEPGELERLLASSGGPSQEPPPPVEPPKNPTTKPGDVWIAGDHAVVCGDARELATYERLLDSPADLVFTSPPYAQQRDYDPESGFAPVPPAEYGEWWKPVQAALAAHLADSGSYLLNLKEHAEDGQRSLYVKDLVLRHVRDWGWRFVDEFCWRKQGVPGRWSNRFKNAWEPIFHFSRSAQIKFDPTVAGTASDHTFDYDPTNPESKTGFVSMRGDAQSRIKSGIALPSNVIEAGAEAKLTDTHSAPFPVKLAEFFAKSFTARGDLVCDPFAGSGSTLIAAARLERRGAAIEISPAYCDSIIERLGAMGLKAKRAKRG